MNDEKVNPVITNHLAAQITPLRRGVRPEAFGYQRSEA
jgi:hypothetical protein